MRPFAMPLKSSRQKINKLPAYVKDSYLCPLTVKRSALIHNLRKDDNMNEAISLFCYKEKQQRYELG